MTKEKVQEAVVEEIDVAKAAEEKTKEPVTTDENTNDSGEELSPWYYFFSQGCGWCKKATPVVEDLNKKGYDILMLDLAESDNQKLNQELKTEYGVQCGTPWFVNADTGRGICGFRERAVIEKWLAGEDIPEPPRPRTPPPRPPFHGSTNKEEITWKKEYKKWVKDNKHMGDEWQKKQKSADQILEQPRPKSDPPRAPLAPGTTEAQIDAWGVELGKWQEENSHIPNMPGAEMSVKNVKQRVLGQDPTGPAGPLSGQMVNPQFNTLDAKVQALEVKVDKIISHFGIK